MVGTNKSSSISSSKKSNILVTRLSTNTEDDSFCNILKHSQVSNTLTEQHTTYKDKISHSLLLRPKRL